MPTKTVELKETDIVTDRQALLDLVAAIELGVRPARLPNAMDVLREPFFQDEFSTGKARTDFSMNWYDYKRERD